MKQTKKSILGMAVFGCKFCELVDGERKCDRKNFDSLLWSLVTVFQVRANFLYSSYFDFFNYTN